MIRLAARALVVAFVVTVAVSGCGISMQTGLGGLRTYAVDPGVLCTMTGDLNPLEGVLHGGRHDPERVWLATLDRHRVSIAWPQGFGVDFRPDMVLLNDRGQVVAREGDRVVLDHLFDYPGDGTAEHPYLASRAFGGCYPARR